MNFTLMSPTLQHRSLVKIATSLWSHGDVRNRMSESIKELEERWKEVEYIVVQEASKLGLPVKLKTKLLGIIEPVGRNILAWMKFHRDDKIYNNKIPDLLFWTAHGIIDSKRTVEVMVKDETLSVKDRFMLACIYCLVDDVVDLQKKFCCIQDITLDEFFKAFWSLYIEGNDEFRGTDKMKLEDLFLAASLGGYEVLTWCIFPKLDPKLTEKIKVEAAESVAIKMELEKHFDEKYTHQYGDVLLSLLSTMNEEQQAGIFRGHTYGVLKSLIFWPKHSLFLEIAKDKWEFLEKECYKDLLHNIVDSMCCKQNYLSEIFSVFWSRTPEVYRKFTVNRDDVVHLLVKLFQKEDETNARLVLKDSSISARRKFILDAGGRYVCRLLLFDEKWDSLKYLIQQCTSSAEEIINFKNQYSEFVPYIYEKRWNKFFQLLKDCLGEYEKSKYMEDNDTSYKRKCCKDIRKL